MGVVDTQTGSGHDAFKFIAFFWLDKKGNQTLKKIKCSLLWDQDALHIIYYADICALFSKLYVFISKTKQNWIWTVME